MELKELANFLKIAEYENISRAAQELHIAQPHLTRQLQSLEEELHVQLFIREKKRLHITRAGRFLKQQAEQLLGLAQKTKDQITEMESGLSGTLYIGSIETAGIACLPRWIAGFKSLYPRVCYNLWSGNSTDVVERLERGLIDLALVRGPFDRGKYEYLTVLEEHWIALINRKHELACKDSAAVSLEELSGAELLVPTQRIGEVTGWFREKGLDAHIFCGFSPLMNAVVMVKSNLGIAILPESCKKILFTEDVIVKDLLEEKSSSAAFVWKKNCELSGTAKRFLKYVGENPVR